MVMRTWAGLSAAGVLVFALGVGVASAGAADAPAATKLSPETTAAAKELIGDAMVNGQAYEYDRELADTIGPRLTGSQNYMKAAEWGVAKFKELGLSNVHTEDWTIPATWEPEVPATGRIVSPVEHTLHIYSLGWSPSTPEGGVKGPVVMITSMEPAALDAQKAKLKGAIAVIDGEAFGGKPKLNKIFDAMQRLEGMQPAALLTPGGPNGTETLTSLNFMGTLEPLPAAQIGAEDESLIKRLAERGPVEVEFNQKNRIRKDVKVPNVVAEIRGRELPDQVVIVGAHLDSWQPGTGAQDNGTGAASVVEAARAIRALNRPPRRTMRFILFGGEEEGLLGSLAYVKQHQAEMPKIDAVVITDTGSQPPKGWYLMGRDDEKASVEALKPLLSRLGADGTSPDTDFIFETDHAGFDVLGVPTLVLWNDVDKYFKLHHRASDTFDSVNERDLTEGASATTVTAYAIADSAQPFAAHDTPEQVQEFLKKGGNLEDYEFLKKMGSLP